MVRFLCENCQSSNVVCLVFVEDLLKVIAHEFIDLKCKSDKYRSKRRLRRHVQSGVTKGNDGRLGKITELLIVMQTGTKNKL